MRSKKEVELSYFHRLISLANIPVVPNSIQQPDPPAPDVLCEVVGRGGLAVELVALDVDQTI